MLFSCNLADQSPSSDREIETTPKKQETVKALETLYKFFEYSAVGNKTIFEKIYELSISEKKIMSLELSRNQVWLYYNVFWLQYINFKIFEDTLYGIGKFCLWELLVFNFF